MLRRRCLSVLMALSGLGSLPLPGESEFALSYAETLAPQVNEAIEQKDDARFDLASNKLIALLYAKSRGPNSSACDWPVLNKAPQTVHRGPSSISNQKGCEWGSNSKENGFNRARSPCLGEALLLKSRTGKW